MQSNPERRRRPGRGIGHRRSNLGVSLIFYLYKIIIFSHLFGGIVFKLKKNNERKKNYI